MYRLRFTQTFLLFLFIQTTSSTYLKQHTRDSVIKHDAEGVTD